TDRHLANQIVALALKKLMRLDVQDDVKISRRPAANAPFAVARRAQPRAGVHARWNFNRGFGSALAPSGAVARAARFFDHSSRAFAPWTRLRNAENPARADHLPAPAAGRTRFRGRARLRARTPAGLAQVELRDRDFFFAAQHRFLERNLQIITKIGATPRSGRILPFAAEQFIEDAAGAGAEDFAENLKRIMEAAAPKTSAGARARIEGSMAVLVVSSPRLRIAQGFVGFAQFLEFFLGGFVAGIFVGMILEGHLAIGLFDFLLTGVAVHPEDFVIIAFGHGGQTAGFLATTTLAGRIRRSRNL